MTFKAEQGLARRWRERQGSDCERSLGYVVIFNGSVAGWKRELDNPQGWEPGCLAVSPEGEVFQAVGGNGYDGAQVWQRLEQPDAGRAFNVSLLAVDALDEFQQLLQTALDRSLTGLPAQPKNCG